MRAKFWDLEEDSRFDIRRHYEPIIWDDQGNVAREERLTEEGTELAKQILLEKLKDWDNDVKWYPGPTQGRYIIAVSPDHVRHAMERSEARPSLFVARYSALCGSVHKEYDWTLMVNTTSSTVYQTGAVNCDYCMGILTFVED